MFNFIFGQQERRASQGSPKMEEARVKEVEVPKIRNEEAKAEDSDSFREHNEDVIDSNRSVDQAQNASYSTPAKALGRTKNAVKQK